MSERSTNTCARAHIQTDTTPTRLPVKKREEGLEDLVATHTTSTHTTFSPNMSLCMIQELTVTCIIWNTVLTMISIVGKYEDPCRQSQAYQEIDYLEHTR